MARPRNTSPTVVIELSLPQKLADYLDELKEKETFGNSRSEIIRNFVLKEVNRLIESGRLQEQEPKAAPTVSAFARRVS